MASYDAVVNLNVVGTSRLERVNAAVGQLNDLTRQLNSNFNLLAPGAGKLGDKLRIALEPINNFAREAANGTAKLANTLAGAAAQAQALAIVLDNVKIKAGGLDAQEARVKNLSAAWLETTLNAQRYQKVQEQLQASQLAAKGLMQLGSGEIVRGTEAGVGVQGPRLPAALGGGMNLPPGETKLAPTMFQGIQGAFAKPGRAGLADALIGGAFPLLFGGGPGAALGGFAGGFAGGAIGGPLGMALSVTASAGGQKLDQAFAEALKRISEIDTATRNLDLDTLRDSVIAVNADLDITVERLIKAGQAETARAEIGKQVALQTGMLPEAVSDIANNTALLNNTWNEFLGAVSGTLSIIATPFASALTFILQGLAKALQAINIIATGIASIVKGAIEWAAKTLGLGGALEWIKEKTTGINEEQERLSAELERQTDTYSRQIGTSLKLEEIDKRRNKGNTADAKIQNNELDRQAKIVTLRGEVERKIAEERLKFKGKDISLLEDQIRAEAAIEERAINREAARKRERLEMEKALDVIRATLKLEESRIDIGLKYSQQATDRRLAELAVNKDIIQAETTKLQSQQKYSLSLNQTSSTIDKIASQQLQSAQIEQQSAAIQAEQAVRAAIADRDRAAAAEDAARREWALADDLTEEKKAQLMIAIEDLQVAEQTIKHAEDLAHYAKVTAAAKYESARYSIDLERREALAAAYAEETAIQAERTARALNEQVALQTNKLNLTTTINKAQTDINNAQIAVLRMQLEEKTNYKDKIEIMQLIYDLELNNARLAYETSVAQIKAQVIQQELAVKLVEAEYAKLLATVKMAEAQGVVNRYHYEALDAQASALRIAEDTLATTYKMADAQLEAADAVYKSNVLLLEQQNIKDRAALKQGEGSSISGTSGTSTQSLYYTAEEAKALKIGPYAEYASGGYVTGPTNAMIGEGGEPEYVIPASKMNEAMARYASGQRGSSVIPNAATSEAGSYSAGTSSINPVVNVTTGPVMNMNNSNYVSQADFLAGLQVASRQGARMALATLQGNNSMRRSVGIR